MWIFGLDLPLADIKISPLWRMSMGGRQHFWVDRGQMTSGVRQDRGDQGGSAPGAGRKQGTVWGLLLRRGGLFHASGWPTGSAGGHGLLGKDL